MSGLHDTPKGLLAGLVTAALLLGPVRDVPAVLAIVPRRGSRLHVAGLTALSRQHGVREQGSGNSHGLAASREYRPCPQMTAMPLRTPMDCGWMVGNGALRLRLLFLRLQSNTDAMRKWQRGTAK